MTRLLRIVTSVMPIFFAAGCLGGGEDSDTTNQTATIADQIALAAQLADEIEVLDSVEGSSLPDMGSVDYSGNLGVTVNDGTSDQMTLFGSMTMTANFADSLITGDVRNFVDTNSTIYSGSASLENGTINDMATATETITADLDGEITGSNGQVLVFDASLTGGFYGDDETHVTGDVEGSISIDSVATNIDNGQFAGAN